MLLDSAQLILQQKLHSLSQALETKESLSLFNKIFSKNSTHKSLYIYGGVGRGKSMLMREFFNSPIKTPKIYFHFNDFMRLVHENLHNLRKEQKNYPDELLEVIKRIIPNQEVICFDEFQVLDIADAMLLSRIFSFLFSKNKIVIFTSNSHPKNLYKNGLQREIFLEFVDKVLLKNCEVILLENNIDYRTSYKKNLNQRYFISNKENRALVKDIMDNLIGKNSLYSQELKVWGRKLKINKTFGKIAIINFDEICAQELAAADYQAICKNFDLIFLLKVPKLTSQDFNLARRFIVFIDEVYENKTALIVLAKTLPNKIYENGAGSEAFQRTISRINEIKSDYYWKVSKFIV